MNSNFKTIVDTHTQYIFRREALRMLGHKNPTNPLKPTFIYKTEQSFSSLIDHSNFPKTEHFLQQVLIATLHTIDEHYKKNSFKGLIIEYKDKPILIFEQYEYDNSPFCLFLHVDLQEIHSEILMRREIKEYIVRTHKRIDMMMLGVCFFCLSLLCCFYRDRRF